MEGTALEPARFFAELEADTRALVQDLSDGWAPEEIASIRGDIDGGEWGLAIEQVAGAIVRLDKPLTRTLLAKIDSIARRTKMTRSRYLQTLHVRATQIGIDGGRLTAPVGPGASRSRSGSR
jgi:hypothetical protein